MLLKIGVPVYRRDRWNRLEQDGAIEVSSEVGTLSEAYPALKKELDPLLARVDAETRLAETAEELQLEIDQKARKLTQIAKDIERASKHYESLKLFLQKLGIDPNKKQLTFDQHLLLSSGSVSDVAAKAIDNEFF
ncbi:MAG: hypothetical protein ICV80_17790 [Microcoleus sp. T1-bin1]|nr:hypothetical protein [Microcoleus sp. T1-bin1]